ncbi:hypothetical protein Bbelb_307930 [Branchiostoma belcheri]|nr:hypothetical protein Bbelb_307930 [Branchiostoma belcheri]
MGPYHCLRGKDKLASSISHLHPLPVEIEDISEAEVRTLHDNKSPGMNSITSEMLKAEGDCVILFPVAIDWVLGKQQEKRGVKGVAETKRHCDIAENTRELQPLVTNIVRLQAALGSASGPKAISMLIGTRAPLGSVTIDKNKWKVAENFTYLGSSTQQRTDGL